MRPNWEAWKARLRGAASSGRASAARLGSAAGAAAWAGVVTLLAAALVVQGGRSRGEAAALEARSAALDREIGELRRRNRDLRDEVLALESDPVYVEALLRRWKRVGEGERLVE